MLTYIDRNSFDNNISTRSKDMERYRFSSGIIIAAILALSSFVLAGVPMTLNHQGRLLDATGDPVSDGVYTLVYSLYSEPAGGTAIWTETQDVTTTGGLFSVMLGSINPLTLNEFDPDSLYLETQLQGLAPMSPRLSLGVVPFAGKSGRIDGDITTAPGQLVVGDLDGDGMLDLISSSDVSELHLARKRPGRVKYSNITLRVMEDSLSDYRDTDSDDDGIPESEYLQKLTPTVSALAIKTKGTGAKRLAAGGDCDDTDSEIFTDCDDDGDGISENRTSASSSSSGATMSCATDVDHDGEPDLLAFMFSEPVSSRMAIKTKGTGADKDRVASVTSSTDNLGSSVALAMDLDGDGVPDRGIDDDCDDFSASRAMSFFDVFTETSITDSVDAAGARRKLVVHNLGSSGEDGVEVAVRPGAGSGVFCDSDSDGDGVPDAEASVSVLPAVSSVAIKTKGTGADKDRVASVSTTTSGNEAGTLYSMDVDSDGLLESSLQMTCDASSALIVFASKKGYDYYMAANDQGARMVITNDVNDTTIDIDGDGHLGVGKAADVTRMIDVAGGAYCDGTDWINASDANVKENFRPVDGRKLLEDISELEITRWNYKGDSEMDHIGPTAQDFQRIFGVGSDGKSISTIDPPGIALAAIKELYKENISLKEQIAELRKQIAGLQASAADTGVLRAEVKQLSSLVELILGARTDTETTNRLASAK